MQNALKNDLRELLDDPPRLGTLLAGSALIVAGLSRRSAFGLGLATAGTSLVYRALTGRTLQSLIMGLVARRSSERQDAPRRSSNGAHHSDESIGATTD